MNIVVCVRTVPNPYWLVEVDREAGRLSGQAWPYVINPCDEVAVEAAIRIKERQGKGSIVVIGLGPGGNDDVLRWCLAMGADNAIRVRYDDLYSLDGFATATILSGMISTLKYDLVLCGDHAIDWPNGGVGVMIGELLGLPAVTSVVEMAASGGSITVSRLIEKGDRQLMRCDLPAVLTVKMTLYEPRYPSLPKIKKSLKTEIAEVSTGALAGDNNGIGPVPRLTETVSISRPPPRKVFVPPANLSPEERINLLIAGTARNKKTNLLKGSATEVAGKLVEFLMEAGILPGKSKKRPGPIL